MTIFSRKPRSHVRILIYRTWAILQPCRTGYLELGPWFLTRFPADFLTHGVYSGKFLFFFSGLRLTVVSVKTVAVCCFMPNTHRAEYSDTSGTFSIACSAKFEITRVKRRETIKKMAENGATSTAPCLFSFYTAH